jgi:hypothetical protein
VPSPAARAERLRTQLSAAGFTPRVLDRDDHVSVETHVPDDLTERSWRGLLTLLEGADRFGLVDSSKRGRTAWAAISKEAPETARGAVRGHGNQL